MTKIYNFELLNNEIELPTDFINNLENNYIIYKIKLKCNKLIIKDYIFDIGVFIYNQIIYMKTNVIFYNNIIEYHNLNPFVNINDSYKNKTLYFVFLTNLLNINEITIELKNVDVKLKLKKEPNYINYFLIKSNHFTTFEDLKQYYIKSTNSNELMFNEFLKYNYDNNLNLIIFIDNNVDYFIIKEYSSIENILI